MASVELGENAGFEEATTYAVAATVFVIVLVSLVVERGIQRLKKYLKTKNQKPLRKVVEKMTQELMLLGFISLLLTVLQTAVSKICVTDSLSRRMLPCNRHDYEDLSPAASLVPKLGRRLLSIHSGMRDFSIRSRRYLQAEEFARTKCKEGSVPFISRETLHEIHIFIFVLAATHVCYSAITMLLGFTRLHRWRRWEKETQVDGYAGEQDLQKKYRAALEARKASWASWKCFDTIATKQVNHPFHEKGKKLLTWLTCFFQQFAASVSREDYLVFRVRFLNTHNLPEPFNFWDYVIRSMEVEFKTVIGISWWLWLFVTIFLLLNVHGWYTYFWAAFIPTIILLVIGTMQQHVISTLALQAKRRAANVIAAEGTEMTSRTKALSEVPPGDHEIKGDKILGFARPAVLLKLLHFVIFQNSFELAFFFWLVITFGWNSCVLGNHKLLIVRIIVGLLTQLLASYSTLPIYALVTQMVSQMKGTIFRKDVHQGLQAWRDKAQRKRMNGSSDSAPNGKPGTSKADQNVPESAAENGKVEPGRAGSEQKIPSAAASHEGTTNEIPVPDPSLANRFQLMYGKVKGLEKMKSGDISNMK